MTFDEKLKIAAADAVEHIAVSINDEMCHEHAFSAEFENRISNLTENWSGRKRIIKQYEVASGNTGKHMVLRYILIAAAVILLACGITLAVSPEIRASVFGWFRDTFGIYITYEYQGEGISDMKPEYELGWMPEGYHLDSQVKENLFIDNIYINSDGEILIFSYYYGAEGAKLFINPENTLHKNVYINGVEGNLLIAQDDDEGSMIVWFNKEKDILFSILINTDETELIKMADNVQYKK